MLSEEKSQIYREIMEIWLFNLQQMSVLKAQPRHIYLYVSDQSVCTGSEPVSSAVQYVCPLGFCHRFWNCKSILNVINLSCDDWIIFQWMEFIINRRVKWVLCNRWPESPGSPCPRTYPLGWRHMHFDSGKGRQQGLYIPDCLSVTPQQYLDGEDDAGEQNMEGSAGVT